MLNNNSDDNDNYCDKKGTVVVEQGHAWQLLKMCCKRSTWQG